MCMLIWVQQCGNRNGLNGAILSRFTENSTEVYSVGLIPRKVLLGLHHLWGSLCASSCAASSAFLPVSHSAQQLIAQDLRQEEMQVGKKP